MDGWKGNLGSGLGYLLGPLVINNTALRTRLLLEVELIMVAIPVVLCHVYLPAAPRLAPSAAIVVRILFSFHFFSFSVFFLKKGGGSLRLCGSISRVPEQHLAAAVTSPTIAVSCRENDLLSACQLSILMLTCAVYRG